MKRIAILTALAVLSLAAQPYTRGVGVYPGDPREDFAPSLVPDSQTYRNLALHRPAYQSSAYDYNLTAQLVTDGIKETKIPRWLVVSTSQGLMTKPEREHAFDHNPITTVDLNGPHVWLQWEFAGGDAVPEIDRVELTARVQPFAQASGAKYQISGSDDGRNWQILGGAMPRNGAPQSGRGALGTAPPMVFSLTPSRHRFLKVEMEAPAAARWSIGEIALYDGKDRVEPAGPYHFSSAWMSAGANEEWVSVDLGAVCTFDRIALSWIRRASEGALQTSDDSRTWRTLQPLSAADDVKLAHPERGRFVRVLMTRPAAPDGYILSELEVYGRGGPLPKPKPPAVVDASGRLNLAGGAWRIQRDSLVNGDGKSISQVGFKDADWLVATVPATVLSSYWNAGALPDPNYGDNQLAISDSFFWADFWYRDEFVAPPVTAGRRQWLDFRGINWKAEVYLNGERLADEQMMGRIEGGFMRARFDVTGKLQPGRKNAIAVRIIRNATPGSVKQKTFENPDKNGGALGADNPTYHATIGWDWIPTIRGRDIGIWSGIILSSSGPVTLENPLVSTTLPLPDTSSADVKVEVTLRNSGQVPLSGTLRGHIGAAAFEQAATVTPGNLSTVKLDVHLQNPKLWWPAGYGDQNLYPVDLQFVTAAGVSDKTSFQTGIRQFTYSEEGGTLKIWINGRRFIAKGGNWGFPESMLRYRAREYDIAVRYHKDMNFTMIRNWVGQTGDDEFFDACDKYGIVVWQDFWLANPADGPDPDDNELFLKNARDFIRRIRNHPSVGLYCGRNEGNPPKPIDDGLRAMIPELHPNLHYISSSSFGPVSGGGPYRTIPPKQYFATRATPKLHSELGMPNIVTMDSLRQMMPEEAMWPQGEDWGIHDFTMTGAQGGTAWREMIDKNYGGAANVAEWVELSQFINYDGYRAIFEAQSKNRMGVLLWMSHPCWPSFVWPTYDYYFDQSAGYFGSKKGSEPLHIQWNPLFDTVEVVNYSAGSVKGLTARVELLNLDGSKQWEKTAALDSSEDSVESPIKIEYPAGLTPVHFIRLTLSRAGQTVSGNFYMRGVEENNFTAIRSLPKVQLDAATKVEQQGAKWILSTELRNTSTAPALMVRVKAVREKTGDRILPAIYSDNYIALMPGETRTIRTELENVDTRGERPRITVEGFNTR